MEENREAKEYKSSVQKGGLDPRSEWDHEKSDSPGTGCASLAMNCVVASKLGVYSFFLDDNNQSSKVHAILNWLENGWVLGSTPYHLPVPPSWGPYFSYLNQSRLPQITPSDIRGARGYGGASEKILTAEKEEQEQGVVMGPKINQKQGVRNWSDDNLLLLKCMSRE